MTEILIPPGYAYHFDDLPNYNAAASASKRWAREFKWRNTETEFERKEAALLLVTVKQHEQFKGLLRESAAVTGLALRVCLSRWPDAFPVAKEKPAKAEAVNKKLRDWPYGLVRDFMERVQEDSRAAGYERGSLMQNLRERAAAYAMTTIRTGVWAGKAPSLPFDGELPVGLSFRLNLGTQYGKPFDCRAEGWLGLGPELGWVMLPPGDLARLGGPQGLAQALYLEIGHTEQTWKARAVFAKARTRVQRVA